MFSVCHSVDSVQCKERNVNLSTKIVLNSNFIKSMKDFEMVIENVPCVNFSIYYLIIKSNKIKTNKVYKIPF